MKKQCTNCDSAFEITKYDLAFYDKVSPVFGGRQYAIPPPQLCPICRQRRRYAFRNERRLYRRTSCLTGKEIISAYSKEKPLNVCERDEWLKIDNTDYGREFDFSRSFFDQFSNLYKETVKANVIQNGENINSDYSHFCGWLKNCYLLFDCGKSEDCMYGVLSIYCKNCVDTANALRCELCYNVIDVADCYNTIHASFCKNCSFSAFLRDCIGCKHCLFCANLRNKEYHIFNQPVTKEEYDKKWNAIFSGKHSALQDTIKLWNEFQITQPCRNLHNIDSPNCTGDYLMKCENAIECYECSEAKDIRYCQNVWLNVEKCMDVSTFGEDMSFCYELSAAGGVLGKTSISNCAFSVYLFYGGHNIYYSMNCHDNCKDLFGCCDLRGGKQFCILNKQYSKEEYTTLVPQIITHMKNTGEWGEFFPMKLSPFAYNETIANEYLPLAKVEALQEGFRWKDGDEMPPDVNGVIDTSILPDALEESPENLSQSAMRCAATGKLFNFPSQELAFYRKMNLPLPRLHPDERHRVRLQRRNPRKLWGRTCKKCGKTIQASFVPDRPEIVYCEECYLQAVY